MRSTPLLLLALACSHAQPEPPPLAVPEANAAGPAAIPDGGVAVGDGGLLQTDAGLPRLPDAGVVDAGVPDAGPRDRDAGVPDAGSRDGGARADLVSPITAAGSETPVGLDWGPKGEQPARTLFKNVKLLGDLSGDRMMAGMQSMKANLGVKCTACHLVKEKDFASDAKKEKLRARDMIQMTEEINRRTFKGEVKVTCWMCHRGEEKPESRPFSREIPKPLAKLTPEQLAQPAEKVFKDVRILKGMDGRNFAFIMGWFSRELGVKCTHCHQENDFAADHEKKTRAREMLEMTSYVAAGYYGNNSPVACGTCHAGKAEPARTPGDKS
jgi:Photosynthetic reaction centre cytochrome C subunit